MEKGFTITYEYGDNLYVNPTNRCDFNCTFCLRHNQGSGGSIYTHNLWLEREPTREELPGLHRGAGTSRNTNSWCSWLRRAHLPVRRHLLGHRPDEGARHEDLHPDGHQRHRLPHQRAGTSARTLKAGSTWCPCP